MRRLRLLLIIIVLGMVFGTTVGASAGYTMNNMNLVARLPNLLASLVSNPSTSLPTDPNVFPNVVEKSSLVNELTRSGMESRSSPELANDERNLPARLLPITTLNNGTFVQWSRETSAVVVGEICGDLDGNSLVTIEDALSILKIVTDLLQLNDSLNILGDLNQDRDVNIMDAIVHLKVLVSDNPIPDRCGPTTEE